MSGSLFSGSTQLSECFAVLCCLGDAGCQGSGITGSQQKIGFCLCGEGSSSHKASRCKGLLGWTHGGHSRMLPSDDRWSGDWAVTSLSLIDHVECLVLCYMYKIPVLSANKCKHRRWADYIGGLLVFTHHVPLLQKRHLVLRCWTETESGFFVLCNCTIVLAL